MANKIQCVEDLIVWQKAHNLVLEIYKITKNYPKEEKFSLISQMCRSAISVPANISEGFKKRTSKDKINFISIAQGSLNELRYYVRLSKDLDYIADLADLTNKIDEIGRMFTGVVKAIECNNNK